MDQDIESIPSAALDVDLDPRFLADPWGTWAELRRDHAIFRAEPGTPNGEDIWVCTRERTIREVYRQGPEYFSNQILFPYLPPGPRVLGLVQMDPPEHTALRRAMAPLLAPDVINAMRPRIREECRRTIGEFIERGECEFVSEFAKRYVAAVFMKFLGVPLEHLDEMLQWAYDAVHLTAVDDPDHSKRSAAMWNIRTMMSSIADERRISPKDDLVTAMLRVDEAVGLSPEDFEGTLVVLFNGGLDTTAGSLSFAVRHFAEHPEDRILATANPEATKNATEEMLRAFGILNATKLVVKDTVVGGCPIKAGDRIVLATSSAGRDEEVFPDGDVVRFDRESYRHVAFGLGPHRCIGSHIARAEIEIFIEEWHALIPDYWITDARAIAMHGGVVMGIDHLPLGWKVGA